MVQVGVRGGKLFLVPDGQRVRWRQVGGHFIRPATEEEVALFEAAGGTAAQAISYDKAKGGKDGDANKGSRRKAVQRHAKRDNDGNDASPAGDDKPNQAPKRRRGRGGSKLGQF